MAYKVLVNCEGGEKRFEPGDVIKDGDFPKSVIQHWLEKGVLEKTVSAPKPKTKKGKED